MKKLIDDWEIWFYVILFFTFLIGLFYLIKFITPLPYLLLIATTCIIYLIYKGKLTTVKREDSASVVGMLFFVIVLAGISFLANPYRYKNYLGQLFVSGKIVTKTVMVEADEGPNVWEERRKIWVPDTEAGETIMEMISYFNFGLVITTFFLCIKFYLKCKDREDSF
ncbi:MAG TPA: hypothetical protein PKV73_17550 [Agriterribacter sp.]|nr:hypothetical protein [Chitinophagaceae bacterium]HRP33708.1 hypothetical protein [Agriterribacter sp.]